MTEKVVFTTPRDALLALSSDRLGCVYYKAKTVFVVTAFGSGEFSRSDWDLANGPQESVKGQNNGE